MNAFILPLAIGAPQIILIVVVILLLFGGRKIPELMRGLGSGIKEFKDASKDDDGEKTVPSDDKKFSEEKK
jgi:sec-independent protein translocase protein TatA